MLQTINIYGQLLASFAVVATLIFVAVQVRISVAMIRHQAMSDHAEKFQSISRMMVEGDGVAELWIKAKDGMKPLTDVERARYVNLSCYMLRAIEELFLQHRAGLVDKAFWESSIRILKDAQALAGPQEVWAVRRHIFMPDFRAFVDGYVVDGEARALYDAPRTAAA